MKVKVYAIILANKPSPRTPMYNNEWRISETKLVHTAIAICGVKIEHSRLKPMETREEFVTSY
jgi:hypothetical protein